MSQLTIDDGIDRALVGRAEVVSRRSLDPSTKVGCVLATQGGYVIAEEYNRFPRSVHITSERLKDRTLKYAMTVHAEINAVLAASSYVAEGIKFTAYFHPMPPCATCAGVLIQAGCVRVVSQRPSDEQLARWGDSFAIMETMLIESGVRLDYID